MTPFRRTIIISASLVAGVVLLFWWSEFYTDWLWFRADAYPVVFQRRLVCRLLLFVSFGAIAWLTLAGNLALVRRRVGDRPGFASLEVEAELKAWLAGMTRNLTRWMPPTVALITGLGAAAGWLMWLQALAAQPFGAVDPLYGREISFYIFRLPVWRQVLGSLSTLLVVTLGATIVLGYAVAEIRVVANEIRFGRGIRAQILVLIAGLLVLRAGQLGLRRFELVLSQRRLFAGANWVDVHVMLPAIWLSLGTALLAALICLWIRRPGRAAKAGYVALSAHVLVHVLGLGLTPAILQRVKVTPNEIDLERPYIERAMVATRQAFGLDQVETRQFPAAGELDEADLRANQGTIDNLRIWDHQPLLRTFSKLQEIRPYYDVIDVDSDRYRIGGRLRQVLVAARELNHAKLDAKAQSWINLHVEYTHGVGLVLSEATTVGDKGQPEFLVGDIPPRTVDDLPITEPRIYFGEMIRLPAEQTRSAQPMLPQAQQQAALERPDEDALRLRRRLNSVQEPDETDYLLVGTSREELDYVVAAGGAETKLTTRYQGKSGVELGGFFRRLLWALRFHSVELLLTGVRRPETKLLLHRQVTRRCQRAAPFLRWDDNPYPVLVDGRILWICEGYTYSAGYPYSRVHLETIATPRGPRRVPTWSYLRNPVKAVVDAYHGTMDFYLVDDEPIAATLDRAFPGLFRPAAEAPAAVREHFRYPQLLFRTQASILREYHMTDPTVFYTQEDLWSIAQEVDRELERQLARAGKAARGAQLYREMQPTYITMRLPGAAEPEFLLLLPFTPYSAAGGQTKEGERDNLIAWMVARCDPAGYGDLVVYRFPKDTNIYGPRQVENRIDQDDAISQQITLWDKGGSRVLRGNLLVVPIESSLLYLQPLYLESDKQGFPELKRIILAYGDRIVMEPTLDAALRRLFGAGGGRSRPRPAPSAPPTAAPGRAPAVDPGLLAEAEGAFEASESALRRGDWAAYEQERDRLGELLRRLGGGDR